MGEIPEAQMGKQHAMTGHTHGNPRRMVVAAGMFAAWMLMPTTPAGAEVTYETRVLSGDAAPGAEEGASFHLFYPPTINAAGQIAFRANLIGDGVDGSNDRGIWSEAAGAIGSPGLVAREGDAAPGTTPGVNFSSLTSPVLYAGGQTAFTGVLIGTGVDSTNNVGIWSEAAGSVGSPGLVAREGDAAPETSPGVNFSSFGFGNPVLNAAGQTAFRGFLTGNGVDETNDEGIWSEAVGSVGSLGLVARTGDAAPGTTPEVNFSDLTRPVLNDAGQIAFQGSLTGTGVDDTNDTAIWSEAAGSIGSPGLIARTGNAAPGTTPGVNFSSFTTFSLVLNDAGQTAFAGSLTGTGVDDTNNEGIWSEAAGSIGSPALVAREGDAAPGTTTGVNFSSFRIFVLNDAGQIAFRGDLTGSGVDSSNDEGIWSEAAGSIGSPALVAREGDAAPGTMPGVNFSSFSFGPYSINSLVLNTAGQIAFRAGLTGTGVDGSNDLGIWATDSDGLLTLVIREGDLFDVDDDPLNEEFRTVASVAMYSGSDRSFNDAGQLAFRATFTDGSSGIFVANTVASTLLGDYNGDGFVSQADLDLVLLNWGDTVMPDGFDPAAVPGSSINPITATFDGLISQNELDGVLLNWGDGNPPNLNAIPEPTSVALLGLGGIWAMRRRRAA